MTRALPEVSRNPYLRANSLAELLSWEDVDFVRCAYVTVLGRQPDTDGEVFYTYQLQQGISKLQILWQLRKSPEGPGHDPGISGFDRALRKSRWERGWLGWLIRPFTGEEDDGPTWRRHRMLVNEFRRANTLSSLGISTNMGFATDIVANLQILATQISGLAEAVTRLPEEIEVQDADSTASEQIQDNPDYRNLSVKGRSIFRKLYAHSH